MGTRIRFCAGKRKIVGSLGLAMLGGLEGVATFAETNPCQWLGRMSLRSQTITDTGNTYNGNVTTVITGAGGL